MNVVLVIRSLGVGGSERQAVNLAAGLTARGHEISFVQLVDGCEYEDEVGMATHRLALRTRADVPRLARFVTLLRRLAPDVVHGFHVESNLLCLAAAPLAGRPSVVWGYRTSSHAELASDLPARVFERVHRLLAGRPDAVVANSDAGAAAAVAEGAPATRVHTIRNGVDTSRFEADPDAGAHVRRDFGVAADAPLIGVVARLIPTKRIELFVEAAALFGRSRPDARFVCVGTGDDGYRAALAELAERRGLEDRLVWAGLRTDMPAVYSALDACTLVSLAEGTSNAVVEALACEVPCVVSDVGDLAFLVGDPRLVVRGEPDAIAAAWEHALSIGAETRASWRRRVEDEYGLDRMVDETEQLLLGLTQERRRGTSG